MVTEPRTISRRIKADVGARMESDLSMDDDDEVHFLELESEEQPGANGWYWTEKPITHGAKGVFNSEGVHGPFRTEEDAIANYEASKKQ
jgi:hypothetical protein